MTLTHYVWLNEGDKVPSSKVRIMLKIILLFHELFNSEYWR